MNTAKILESGKYIQYIKNLNIKEYKKYIKGKKFVLKDHILKNMDKYYKLTNSYLIVYKSQGHNVKGFIVEPKNIKGKVPCIIYNRGGCGEFGVIKPWLVFSYLARISSWGYIVIASQYSGNAGSDGKDEIGGSDINDVLNLKKILKDHPNADLDKIGMLGASRGGLMTYLSLAKVRWIKAAITIAGSANEVRGIKLRPELKVRNKKFIGSNKKEDLIKRSAVYWPEKFSKKTPLLMMHGTGDWRVSPLDSLDLAQKLYEHKVLYRLIMFEGADHSLSEFSEQKFDEIKNWFKRYLKNNESLPNLKPHGK